MDRSGTRQQHSLHHLRGAGLLPADRRRAGGGAIRAEESLPAARFDQRPELRHHRADDRPVSQRAALRGLSGDVRLRDAHGDQPGRRAELFTRRQVAGGDRAVPRRRLCVLLVPPDRPRVQRPLGRARGASFERGLQPGGRAAAGDFSGAFLVGLLPAAGTLGLSACLVRGDVELRHCSTSSGFTPA